MTKIRGTGSNPYVEDRRGVGGATGGGLGLPFPIPGMGTGSGAGCGRLPLGVGGGGLGVLLVLAALLLPKLLNGSGSSNNAVPGTGTSVAVNPTGETCNTETAQIVCGAITDVNQFWTREFASEGKTYTPATTVFFTGSTQTGCGLGEATTGPFYCPVDQKAYFDLDFLDQLQQQFQAQGDLATQYIVAHEYGHHVQNLEGISDQVTQLEQQHPDQANQYSVKLELQADCLAGVWAHDANARGLLDQGDVAEALNAAAAVGDDRIQQQTQGRVDPDSFTHGTSEQRQTWFNRGFTSGSPTNCDTFSE